MLLVLMGQAQCSPSTGCAGALDLDAQSYDVERARTATAAEDIELGVGQVGKASVKRPEVVIASGDRGRCLGVLIVGHEEDPEALGVGTGIAPRVGSSGGAFADGRVNRVPIVACDGTNNDRARRTSEDDQGFLRHSRSPRPSKRPVRCACSAAADAPYLCAIAGVDQPARYMRSPSDPPCTRNSCAHVCRRR